MVKVKKGHRAARVGGAEGRDPRQLVHRWIAGSLHEAVLGILTRSGGAFALPSLGDRHRAGGASR